MGLVGAGGAACLVVAARQAEVAGAAGQVRGAARVLTPGAEVARVALTARAVQPVGVAVVAGGAREAVRHVGAACHIWWGKEGRMSE